MILGDCDAGVTSVTGSYNENASFTGGVMNMRPVYRVGQCIAGAASILSMWAMSAMAQTPPAATPAPGTAAVAAPAAASAISSGDTAWMLTSTALVLMMTIPGLALFYGGMVRKKNVLATVMQ